MEDDIKERILQVIDFIDLTYPQIERRTGVKSTAWKNLRNTKIRANSDHISAIVKIAPEFAYWITTGEELPEAGQISPRTAKTHQKLKQA